MRPARHANRRQGGPESFRFNFGLHLCYLPPAIVARQEVSSALKEGVMLKRLLTVLLLSAMPAVAQTAAIRAGHLIDPETATVADDQIILIKDGKIEAVGAEVEIPAGTQVIDLSQSWVFPGLMDAHTHLTLGASGELFLDSEYLKETTGFRALKGLRNAEVVLRAGFTSVKDIGNDANYAAVDLRRAFEKGWFQGPSMLTTGKIIAPYGGQSHGTPPEIGPFWRFEYIDADTPDEVRKAVRRNIYYGANAIKLVADNSAFHYSVEEIHAAVEEAHDAGYTVAVHAMVDAAAQNAVLAGADSIEHGFQLSDRVLNLMKEKGTFLVGTDFPLEHLQVMGTGDGILPPPEETSRQILDRLWRAHRLGVKMAFG
ncbi:MAG: amidohydrolase family protein, partial [Terriglobia bacterium]